MTGAKRPGKSAYSDKTKTACVQRNASKVSRRKVNQLSHFFAPSHHRSVPTDQNQAARWQQGPELHLVDKIHTVPIPLPSPTIVPSVAISPVTGKGGEWGPGREGVQRIGSCRDRPHRSDKPLQKHQRLSMIMSLYCPDPPRRSGHTLNGYY